MPCRTTCSSVSGMTIAFPGTLSAGSPRRTSMPLLAGEGELAVVVLARARVLRLLHDHDLVAIHLTRQRDGGGEAGVAGRAALQALQLGQQLGDVEDLALGDELVLVHVAQRPGGVARHVDPVGPGRERNAEAGVAGGERLAVEVVVGGHVQAAQVDRAGHDARLPAAGGLKAAGGAGQVAAAGVRDDDRVGLGAVAGAHVRPRSRGPASRPRGCRTGCRGWR